MCMKMLAPACTSPKVVISSAARVNGRRPSTFITRRMAEMKVPAWLMPIQKTVLTRKMPQIRGPVLAGHAQAVRRSGSPRRRREHVATSTRQDTPPRSSTSSAVVCMDSSTMLVHFAPRAWVVHQVLARIFVLLAHGAAACSASALPSAAIGSFSLQVRHARQVPSSSRMRGSRAALRAAWLTRLSGSSGRRRRWHRPGRPARRPAPPRRPRSRGSRPWPVPPRRGCAGCRRCISPSRPAAARSHSG